MLIVEHPSLVEVDGLFTFRGELFSGVSLQTKDGIVSHRRHYASGRYKGTYVNPIFPDSMNQTHILSSAFDDPVDFEYGQDDAYLFKRDHYNGWAYFFRDEICRKEQFISYGFETSGCIYRPDGRLESVGIYEDSFQQMAEWLDNGDLKEFRISESGVFDFTCKHDDDGNLTGIIVKGPCFRLFDSRKYQRIHNPYFDFSFLDRERLYRYLVLGGEEINEDVVRFVAGISGFESLKSLLVTSIRVSPSFLKDLVLNLNLEQLSLNKINGVDFELALEIKKLIPRCCVLLDGRHVLL